MGYGLGRFKGNLHLTAVGLIRSKLEKFSHISKIAEKNMMGTWKNQKMSFTVNNS